MSVHAGVRIDGPGIYPDLPEADYHADRMLAAELGRSLSSSGARAIVKCPALFAYRRQNPVVSDVFDFGAAAHRELLGRGAELAVIDAADYRTAKARADRDLARSAGRIPVLATDLPRIAAMVEAVRTHPTAGEIFHPDADGQAEVSLYWRDDKTGVTCRGRIDWLTGPAIIDLKTTTDAGPRFARSAADFGYYQQAEWYSRGWKALGGLPKPFGVVAVEKDPPHLVRVLWMTDPDALEWAGRQNDRALAVYAECESLDYWPGYPDDVLELPRWAMRDD